MVYGMDHATVRPRVLAFLPESNQLSAVSYVRVVGPYEHLKCMGYPVEWMPWLRARWLAETGQTYLSNYDLVVFSRVGEIGDGRVLDICRKLRAIGKCVVWETDDDYTNEYREVIKADANVVMDAVAAITVSTPYLRAQCAKYTKTPIYLLQNTIDIDGWESVPRQRKVDAPTTVGIVGSKTHYDDWILARDALFQIGDEYPDVHFVLGGYCPDYLEDLPRLSVLDQVAFGEYPEMIHKIDIGLCPLASGDGFNLSKSAIKAMEYWAGGAAVIASNHPVYRRVVAEGRGILCNDSTEEWARAIRFYLDYPEERRMQALAGREWIRKKRNMAVNCQFWWDVYSEVWRKYGGKIDEYLIFGRAMGNGSPNRQGGSGNHVLPVSRPPRRRRRSHADRADASRGRRRADHGRSA